MALLTAGLIYFAQVSVGGSYVSDLLPGFLLNRGSDGLLVRVISIAALAGVRHSDAGLASGLINTSQQVGGALGTSPYWRRWPRRGPTTPPQPARRSPWR